MTGCTIIRNYDKPDPHVSALKFMNDFRCERNVNIPTYWDCKRCGYFYKDSLGCSRCLKKDIQNWVLFREENTNG